MLNNWNKVKIQEREIRQELAFSMEDLSNLMNNSMLRRTPQGTEMVHFNQSTVMNIVQKNLEEARKNKFNPENLNTLLLNYEERKNRHAFLNDKYDKIWENLRKKNEPAVKEVLTEQKELINSNILNYNEFLHSNKETVASGVKITGELLETNLENKPLGSAGDITINELINTGLNVIDTPLVKMIRENLDVHAVGYYISSMVMYKAVVNLYVKAAFGSDVTVSQALRHLPNTRGKEVALFMLFGAPTVAFWMWTGSKIMGGKFVIETAKIGIEGTSSVSTTELDSATNSSFFLFLNKLPRWLKSILKYIAFYIIGLFIVKVLGFNSTIITEIYLNSNVYIIFLLKIWTILNLFVIIYFIWKLYVIVMYANNKEYINPEGYPKFIKNEFLESKDIAINEYLKDSGKVSKHYLKLILLYSTIALINLIIIVLFS